MGLNFHVQLLVKQPFGADPTVIRMPCLGNSAIRRVIAPLMQKHEFMGKQCIPSQGELPFHEDSPAYLAVERLHEDYKRRIDDAHRERDELYEYPDRGNWSVAHHFIESLDPFYQLIGNTLCAAQSIEDNDHISARIVWC